MAAKSILVVDDEPRIAAIARDYLERAGYQVSIAGTGPDALAAARTRRPDLIVLDLGLPHLRDRLAGLELGADDYITKPFSPRELVARVRAVFRRVDGAREPGDVITAGDVILDRPTLRVSIGPRAIEVTPTEFDLLATLARQPGRVFTRAQLLDAIRGADAEAFDRAIDAHVKNLRRKIERDPRRPRYLLTVHGVGYKFAE